MDTNTQHITGGSSQTMTRLRLLIIPLLSTLFGYIGGFTINQPFVMTVFGLSWGLVVMLIAPRLVRLGARSIKQANAPIYIMLPMAFIVLGGSILGHLVGTTPTAFLDLVQHPGYPLFFYALHGPFEWVLMPWALMVNWYHPNRRMLLIVAAVIFYLGRTASALYFAPAALYWSQHPVEAMAQLDQVALWINRDVARVVVQDIGIAALMLIAALHVRFRLMSHTPVGIS